jgi:hypothetical protein
MRLMKRQLIQIRRNEKGGGQCGLVEIRRGEDRWSRMLSRCATGRNVIVPGAVTAGWLCGVLVLQAEHCCWEKESQQAQ